MTHLHLVYPHDDGCPYNRFLLPARFCAEAFEPDGVITCGMNLPPEADVLGVHGLPTYSTLMTIANFKRNGGRFLWSLDDDFTSIPDWNPAKPGEEGLVSHYLCRELADWILCSTPALAKTFDGVRAKVLTAPNLIDLSNFKEMPDHISSVQLPVRVCWVGGRTHKEDVTPLIPVIDKILHKYGQEKVSFVWMGMQPPPLLLQKWMHRGFLYQPSLILQQYIQRIGTLDADVYLCPLADIPFNHSKSNLRVMEGWSLMAAPVVSPVGEYNCVASGKDGRYAATEEEWLSALTRLVTDHEYRVDLGAAGRRRVEKEYCWQSATARRPWYEAFSQILGVPCPSPPSSTPR